MMAGDFMILLITLTIPSNEVFYRYHPEEIGDALQYCNLQTDYGKIRENVLDWTWRYGDIKIRFQDEFKCL